MKRYVCMVAYTDYAGDARVRREAETLAAQGFDVVCLTNKNGETPTRYALDGVEVRELGVGKYRGKSTVAYLSSYLRFLLAASTSCLGLLLKGKLDVPADATAALTGFMINANSLGKASFTAKYGRPKTK